MSHLLFVTIFRICIVFLAFGFIGYALPFILCTMICCCLPCIISILGVHEDLDPNRGATTDTINALVAYKFKSKRVHDGDVGEEGGGVLAARKAKQNLWEKRMAYRHRRSARLLSVSNESSHLLRIGGIWARPSAAHSASTPPRAWGAGLRHV